MNSDSADEQRTIVIVAYRGGRALMHRGRHAEFGALKGLINYYVVKANRAAVFYSRECGCRT